MNQYYGSQLAGKRRLAALSALERDAAQAPNIGRSRAERLLDDSFGALKRARLAPQKSELRFSPTDLIGKKEPQRNAKEEKVKVKVKEETQPPHLILLQLLRRLDLRAKLARTCDLLKRFFESAAGAALLNDWREACGDGDIQPARDNHAWVIFYAAWRLATNENVCTLGDARPTIMYLFENVFKLKHEASNDLMQCKMQPSQSACTLVMPETAEALHESVLPEASETRASMSLKGHTLVEKSGSRPFLEHKSDWRTTYDRLMPVCRIAPLCHNMLYTDDAHIFHRALQALEQVYDSIPEGIGGALLKIKPPAQPESNIESVKLTWDLPTGVELRGWQRDMFVSALPTIFLCGKVPWARVATEQFFRKLYFGRASKFSMLEQHQIEAWQNELTSGRRNATADSAKETREAAIATPGAAHVPIRDVREEIINTDSGAATWAARQIT